MQRLEHAQVRPTHASCLGHAQFLGQAPPWERAHPGMLLSMGRARLESAFLLVRVPNDEMHSSGGACSSILILRRLKTYFLAHASSCASEMCAFGRGRLVLAFFF